MTRLGGPFLIKCHTYRKILGGVVASHTTPAIYEVKNEFTPVEAIKSLQSLLFSREILPSMGEHSLGCSYLPHLVVLTFTPPRAFFDHFWALFTVFSGPSFQARRVPAVLATNLANLPSHHHRAGAFSDFGLRDAREAVRFASLARVRAI